MGDASGRPRKGAKVPDNPTQLLDSIRVVLSKGALGGGKGKGGQAAAMGAEASDNPITCLDDDAMDTSETLAGKGERAPVEGVMDSDIPTQAAGRKSRLGDLHLACETEGHAQWRRK